MDLRFSDADEAFRREVAAWLAENPSLLGRSVVVALMFT